MQMMHKSSLEVLQSEGLSPLKDPGHQCMSISVRFGDLGPKKYVVFVVCQLYMSYSLSYLRLLLITGIVIILFTA